MAVGEMARRLGRSPATISREPRRNASGSDPSRYRASVAPAEADKRARRPKAGKIVLHPPLQKDVQDNLRCLEHWSPEQIANRIVLDYPRR